MELEEGWLAWEKARGFLRLRLPAFERPSVFSVLEFGCELGWAWFRRQKMRDGTEGT
jgi:hypothetical protein